MKKSTLVLIIAGLIGFLWLKYRKSGNSLTGKEVMATYTGDYFQFATDQYVDAGDLVSGVLNNDGSVTMEFYTDDGTHTVTFPADSLTEIRKFDYQY